MKTNTAYKTETNGAAELNSSWNANQMLLPLHLGSAKLETPEGEIVLLPLQLLVVVCAWCQRDKQLMFTPGDACISHGMCEECKARMEEEAL